ncbi:Variant surface glycoprotein [Trypanosoma congolense IL3000]|uniref:Variant surface glycoprotein n=1 Tax=Trypanosoma congolense (strain IL3000) TaxID=1068625 RepID=F9WD84_TRYCI|nr:Variant surface glycoprotein [Trypanosoma congolense IL3000]
MMKFWTVVIVIVVGVAASAVEKNHNGAQHKALCDLMKAAVGRWGEGGKNLSESMSKALNRTIFGNEGGGDITELRKQLPNFYDEVLKGNAARRTACGVQESGQSAPYDMVCLCTKGHNGWPLNESGIETLCGKPKTALGGGDEGWSDEDWSDDEWSDKDRKKRQKELSATWSNVVSPCLEGDIGKDLKKSLETFKEQLVNKSDKFVPDMYQLGKGEPESYSACTGTRKTGVCVMYYNGTQKIDQRPWWEDLEKAIPQEETFQEEKKKREEEERRKKEEAEQDIPQTAAQTSAPPTTNQTDQQHRNANFTTHFHRLNMTSGTLIIPPCPWLLSVPFLI